MAIPVTTSPSVSTGTLGSFKSFDNSKSESVFAQAFTSTMISASNSLTYPYTNNSLTTGQSGPTNTTYWVTG